MIFDTETAVILTQKNSRVDHFNSRLTMTRNAICNNAVGIHFLCSWGGQERGQGDVQDEEKVRGKSQW